MVFWNCPITTHNRGVKKQTQNTAERLTVLGQFCKLIPKYCLANVCAELNKEGIKIAARAFSVWSHIVSMIYCHMAHCISLNDICDGLQNFKGNLNNIRNATAPHRNTLSHANRTRDITLIKKLFWKTVEYYQQTHPNFFTQGGRSYFRLPRRFKRAIRAIDSTTTVCLLALRKPARERLLSIPWWRNASAQDVFLGELEYEKHEGSKPISVHWRLKDAIPAHILNWTQQQL